MKSLVLIATCLLAFTLQSLAQYPHVTVRQIQQVPLDSLLRADTLQNTQPARWTLQTSPYRGDTVTVTALCVVPAKVLTFTAGGYTMLLYDTAATVNNWGGLFVRVNAPADTAQAILDNFLNVEAGTIIEMTGLVAEFPLTSMNSVTQFQPIPGIPIVPIGFAPLPQHIPMEVGDFYHGIFPAPGMAVRYSTGEPFESMLVEFTNLTVDARVNNVRGTFSAVDAQGNQITMYDASRFFTLGHGGTLPFPADPVWQQDYPQAGTRIARLRGVITTVSGSENPRGYRIAPIYRGDIEFGAVLPSITEHRRNPVVVPPDSNARISARVVRQQGGYNINSVGLLYSVNNGPFLNLPMTFQPSDTTYRAQIPHQAADAFVKYFVKAIDDSGNAAILASSAFGGASSDTSRGMFFYTVLNRPLTIRDIQYTPFTNGRTAYLGAQVSVSGIVTADTGNIMVSPLNTGGTNAWYMQSGNDPWSGIWFVTPISDSLAHLRNGDSITITGTVAEQFEVTRIQAVQSPVIIHSTNNPLPAPVVRPTGSFGPVVGNGTPSAEQYEGMLVRFNNVTVTSIDPVFADPTEFEVDDGSGPIIVRRDGTHTYTNVPADTLFGRTLLRVGDQISHVTGIIYFSFNRYKVVPRTNADFGTVTSVQIDHSPGVPAQFVLKQNYPNPFNPATVIRYEVPKAGVVSLTVYNVLGQRVRTLVNEVQAPGTYTVRFDASDLATGMYFYRIHAGTFSQVKKMLLVK
jgi:hypothetical protein